MSSEMPAFTTKQGMKMCFLMADTVSSPHLDLNIQSCSSQTNCPTGGAKSSYVWAREFPEDHVDGILFQKTKTTGNKKDGWEEKLDGWDRSHQKYLFTTLRIAVHGLA